MAFRPISCSVQRALEVLGSALGDLQEVLRVAAPGSTSGDEAKTFVDLFAQAERAAASGIALYAPRVVETGAHAKDGHGSAAEWLAVGRRLFVGRGQEPIGSRPRGPRVTKP